MDRINNFELLVIIVVGIFQLILFFKLWGMTNDIREIKKKYLKSNEADTQSMQRVVREHSNKQFQDRTLKWGNEQEEAKE